MKKPTKTTKKVKKIEAWLVCDGKDIPIDFGAIGDTPKKRMLFVYSTEKAALEQWNGFRIKKVVITYSLDK